MGLLESLPGVACLFGGVFAVRMGLDHRLEGTGIRGQSHAHVRQNSAMSGP